MTEINQLPVYVIVTLVGAIVTMAGGMVAMWKILQSQFKSRFEEKETHKQELLVAKDTEITYYRESLRQLEIKLESLEKERFEISLELKKSLDANTSMFNNILPILNHIINERSK